MPAETIWRRTGRVIWWIGAPVVLLGWLLAPRASVIYVSDVPFSIEVNTLRTSLHPIIGELFGGYRVTAVALTLMVVVTTVSHVRRTRAVRILSLLLPAYVAGIEACMHFSWFGRRHHFTSPPTLLELHHDFRMAAVASVIAVAVTLVIAAALLKWCRSGVAGRISWRAWCAVAPLVAVGILWFAADRIFFGQIPGAP
ncbi:MAG TPA: hypothetical protein VFV49_17065 [Thermoanaerobaculia bacterium]|nr:hypothetical protein [Thermoanaerobaculia bacterium]